MRQQIGNRVLFLFVSGAQYWHLLLELFKTSSERIYFLPISRILSSFFPTLETPLANGRRCNAAQKARLWFRNGITAQNGGLLLKILEIRAGCRVLFLVTLCITYCILFQSNGALFGQAHTHTHGLLDNIGHQTNFIGQITGG